MKVVALVSALVVSFGACGSDEPKSAPTPSSEAPVAKAPKRVIDLTDNEEVERVALASLQAYREKNLERLAALGPPGAREKLIFIEPRNPNYQTLLGDNSWRMKALRAWDGDKLIKISRGVDDNALGWFYEDDQHRYAVEVRKDNGRWYFFDLTQQPKSAKPPAAPKP